MDHQNIIETTPLNTPDEFQFPFKPYPIQELFMKSLYTSIEEKRLGVFESPTGTGKSMSIICGAVKWLFDAQQRDVNDIKLAVQKTNKCLETTNNAGSDWLNSHHKKAKARNAKFELETSLRSIDESEERVKKIIAKACKIRKEGFLDDKRKPAKTIKQGKNSQEHLKSVHEDKEVDSEDMDLILGEASVDHPHSDSEEENNDVDAEKKFTQPKVYNQSCLSEFLIGLTLLSLRLVRLQKHHTYNIFLCSRTHSQLNQLAKEIHKSPYRELGVRVVSLASRQNMCINDSVLRLKNLSLINEACQDLRSRKSSRTTKKSDSGEKLKKLKTSGGCPHTGENSMDLLRGECLSHVYDLEEMVETGRSVSGCPYYTARNCIEDAHVVLVPYNTLLHRKTREASGINVKDSVVIIDEAHNLLDTLGNIHSASATGLQICHSHSFLVQYRDRYQDKFSPVNLLHLNQLIFVVHKLVRRISPTTKPEEPTSVSHLSNFLLDTEIDNINLYTLIDFAERSRLAQKLRGFCDKFQPSVNLPEKNKSAPRGGVSSFLKNIGNKSKNIVEETVTESSRELTSTATSGNPVPVLLSLLNAFTNHSEDGRVVTTVGKSPADSIIKFLLLNPAAHFQDVAIQARSIILAGGTMQPFSEFTDQLFLLSGGEPSRIHTFSCDHVVPPSNILPLAVVQGPSGRTFDFSYNNRNSSELLDELGRLLFNACCVIPAGVVVFFTSYDYEDRVYRHLMEKGVIAKITAKKKVLREPKQSGQVEKVLAEYAEAARKGAMLFSVVGGKLSEGLNFNDHLGRCVVVVGLPYPNKTSPELKEKMSYLEQKIGRGSGSVYYENLCMKAVNQSIGRSVRHINDYAAVLLVDQRYSRPHIQSALPQWIRKSLQTHPSYRPIQGLLAKFFSSKVTP